MEGVGNTLDQSLLRSRKRKIVLHLSIAEFARVSFERNQGNVRISGGLLKAIRR